MGLTEGHLFEDEEPELTESQLEDILWENNQIFERGYQKGFSDGKQALLREQEPVRPIKKLGIVEAFKCGACKWVLGWTTEFPLYCPRCGRKVKWDD